MYMTHVGTAGADDSVYITQVMIYAGASGANYTINGGSLAEELSACERYFEKTYAVGTAPGSAVDVGGLYFRSTLTGTMLWPTRFRVNKYAVPTITIYSNSTGASAKIRDVSAASDLDGSATEVGTNGFTANASLATSANKLGFHFTASAEIS